MHQTLEAFSDRCAFADNALTRLDARVKLILALSAITAILFSPGPLLPLGLFAFCLCAMIRVRLPWRVLLWRMAGPLGIAAVLCLLQTMFSGATPLWQLRVGPWAITFTREGLFEGLQVGARVLGSVSVLILLGTVTPAFKVFAALRWAHMPQTMVDLSLLMYRYIFSLLDEAVEVRGAQLVRLGYVDARRSLASTGRLMGAVVLRALDQADRTHESMLVRLYEGRLPMAELGPIRRAQVLVLTAGLAVLAGAFVLCQFVLCQKGPI